MYRHLQGTRRIRQAPEACAANAQVGLSADSLGLTDDSSFVASTQGTSAPIATDCTKRLRRRSRSFEGCALKLLRIEFNRGHGHQHRLVLPATRWQIRKLPSFNLGNSLFIYRLCGDVLAEDDSLRWCPLILRTLAHLRSVPSPAMCLQGWDERTFKGQPGSGCGRNNLAPSLMPVTTSSYQLKCARTTREKLYSSIPAASVCNCLEGPH